MIKITLLKKGQKNDNKAKKIKQKDVMHVDLM